MSKRLETRIVLRGGISNAEVFQFYRDNKVDLFVNASTSEGLPVSIMEAISFGIPSIATNVGGLVKSLLMVFLVNWLIVI